MAIVNMIPAGGSGGYSAVEYEDSHGGTVLEITTNNPPVKYHWIGLNAEHIQTLGTVNWTLNDTSYSSWTPTTSSSTQIKATTALTTFTADMATYDYAILWHVKIKPAYVSGTAQTTRLEGQYHSLIFYLRRQPSSYASLESDDYYYNAVIGYNKGLADYYNSSSAHAFAYQTSYGIYASGYSPEYSSTISDTPTITIKTPTLYARCHDTYYFSTTAAAAVDQANSTIAMTAELYRMPRSSSFSSYLLKDLSTLYHEGSGN